MLNLLSIVLVLVSSFIGACGNLFMKKATNKFSLLRIWRSSHIWLGLFFYAISVIFYVIALRGEELSVLYPLVSTTYIWITIFSVKFLGEKLNKWKLISLMGIVLGVTLIGLGS